MNPEVAEGMKNWWCCCLRIRPKMLVVLKSAYSVRLQKLVVLQHHQHHQFRRPCRRKHCWIYAESSRIVQYLTKSHEICQRLAKPKLFEEPRRILEYFSKSWEIFQNLQKSFSMYFMIVNEKLNLQSMYFRESLLLTIKKTA